jgi:hypothetical protein
VPHTSLLRVKGIPPGRLGGHYRLKICVELERRRRSMRQVSRSSTRRVVQSTPPPALLLKKSAPCSCHRIRTMYMTADCWGVEATTDGMNGTVNRREIHEHFCRCSAYQLACLIKKPRRLSMTRHRIAPPTEEHNESKVLVHVPNPPSMSASRSCYLCPTRSCALVRRKKQATSIAGRGESCLAA